MMNAPRLSLSTLTFVIAGHLAALAALVQWRGLAPALAMPVMIVDVISEAPSVAGITPPRPAVLAPQPRKVLRQERPRPVAAPPILAAQGAAAPELPAAPAPAPVIVPAPAASPVAAAVTTVATAPRFDADYLDNPAPSYPPVSRRVGEEGKVVLRVFVESTGLPAKVEIRSSSGYERLDKSAAAAVGRWKFIPARQGADTVGAWVLVPIVFSLKA
jgi:periplasmic protein TonB